MLRAQKITLGEVREIGVRGVLVYCSDYHCSHWTAISGDRGPDDARLSDLEPLFVCQACGTRYAQLRPDFEGNKLQRGNVQRPPSMGCGISLSSTRICWARLVAVALSQSAQSNTNSSPP